MKNKNEKQNISTLRKPPLVKETEKINNIYVKRKMKEARKKRGLRKKGCSPKRKKAKAHQLNGKNGEIWIRRGKAKQKMEKSSVKNSCL